MVTKNNSLNTALFALLAFGMIFGGSGCASFGKLEGTPVAQAPTANSTGQYQVQMQGQFGKPSAYVGELDGSVTVQTALERSGAVEKFRNMEITVMRVVAESGRGLKLPVEYNVAEKMVRSDQDYALHPKDIIMVSAKSKTTLDKFVDSIMTK